jgi:predicted HD phosphohydrolase
MDAQPDTPRATFTAMTEARAEDWQLIEQSHMAFCKTLPIRVLDHLKLLDGDFGGFPIDRLSHCLQSATLAHRDGRDEEYVVMALLHDIGDTLAPFNHTDVAAVILKPFVSEKTHWIAAHHGIFQGYYFFHHLGLDRNMRDQFKDHPYYEDCAEFVAKYDQNAFDSDYDNMALEDFMPMVERVFSEPKNSIYIKQD